MYYGVEKRYALKLTLFSLVKFGEAGKIMDPFLEVVLAHNSGWIV